jgi:hypothetical protein
MNLEELPEKKEAKKQSGKQERKTTKAVRKTKEGKQH